MADVFSRISDWLQRVSLLDVSLEDLVAAFGQRLVDGGVPVARVSLGRLMMHPVIGVIDVTWDARSGRVQASIVPRAAIGPELVRNGPFGQLTQDGLAFAEAVSHLRGLEVADALPDLPMLNADLTDPGTKDRFPLYRRLAAEGLTTYVAMSAPFGVQPVRFDDGTAFQPGASVSYATTRQTGFSPREIAGLQQILMPLMIAVRIMAERFFVTELLETYLGRISGRAVLSGQVARGDVRKIDCALVYSDMRGSTALSQTLSADDYVALVNGYFDCAAGAVLDHGGEVLKFVGDGLLAIFPFDGVRRMPEDMCAAALSAAREAFMRRQAMPETARVGFGIALHMGAAVYGNVGSEKRLDFTVTGTSVAQVSRLEEMTRTLSEPLLATGAFAAMVPEEGRSLGAHDMRGFDDRIDIVAFDTAVA